MGIVARTACGAALLFLLGGCGTTVPEIEEFWGTPDDTQIRVNAIAGQVDCELRESFRDLLTRTTDSGTKTSDLDFLKKWGAQAQLILTVEEKSAVTPSVTLISPFSGAMQTVSGAFGASATADATRIDKVTFFYEFKNYIGQDGTVPPPNSPRLSCIPAGGDTGTVFVYSDLKLRQWLYDALMPKRMGTGDVSRATTSDKQVISHEVKFEIVSDGNFSPAWKLVRITANSGNGAFFDARRDRTQDLIITLGPLQTAADGSKLLAPAAQSSAQASEFGASVATELRNATQ